MDSDLHKLANDSLKKMFQDESPGTPVAGDGHIVVKGQRIDVIPSVEHVGNQGGKWISGVRFDLRVDGKDEPKFTFGAVGIGDSKEESQQVTVQEWLAYFGKSFVPALLHLDQGVEVEGFIVYPGFLGIRGQSTGKVAEALGDMDKGIFKVMAPMLSDQSQGAFPMTLNLMIVSQGNGTIEGECRLNGAGSTQGLSLLSHLSWPKNGSSYLLRKYYIFRRK